MAIDVRETWESQQSSMQADETGLGGDTKIARVFTWVSTSPISSTVEVLIATGTPKINDPHPLIFTARVRNVTVSQEGPSYGKINVEYDLGALTTGPGDGDPTLQEPELRWSSVQTEEPIDEDINGNPIETPNGEAIFGLTETVYDLQLSISRNVLSFSPEITYLFQNKVNSEPFLGFPPGVALCSNVSATRVFDGSFNYFRLSVEFLFRAPLRTIPLRAWWKRVLMEGTQVRVLNVVGGLTLFPQNFFEFDPRDPGQVELLNIYTRITQAFDANNEQIGSPVALNAFGFSRQSWKLANELWAAANALPDNKPIPFEPLFQEFQTKAYEDLNGLNLL
jgi:hypothetical protein